MSDAQEMPAKTLRALRDSIWHWVENGKAEAPNNASTSGYGCALCHEFRCPSCNKCPVSQATGRVNCEGTPFAAANLAHWDWFEGKGSAEAFHEASHEMENFLRALVPAGSPS